MTNETNFTDNQYVVINNIFKYLPEIVDEHINDFAFGMNLTDKEKLDVQTLSVRMLGQARDEAMGIY